MTGRERILTALKRGTPDRVPTFEWFIDVSVGQALTGQTDAIEIVEALDLDAINVRPDYSRKQIDEKTFVDEWGAKRKLTGDAIPATMGNPIQDISKHEDYVFPDPAAPHRFATLERAIARFDGRRAVILNLRDGWSDMRDLLGYENSLMAMLTEMDHFRALLDRVVDYNLSLAREAAKRYGVEVVATTDDVANAHGMLMDPRQYLEIIGPAFAKAIRGYKGLGLFCIKHCDGDPTAVMDFWIESGIDCFDPVDPGAGLRMADFKRQYGDRICLKGNIDCAGVLCTGTEEEVRSAVRDCIAQAGPAGLIVSSSNTIHRGVCAANYRAMLEELRK
ncbi:MAG: hypothetical protein NTX50_28460 [Candidatus Sumerlaeota bacterium]|nr:hypothetical protein [Candidatus Sumerlaeota bacterium]